MAFPVLVTFCIGRGGALCPRNSAATAEGRVLLGALTRSLHTLIFRLEPDSFVAGLLACAGAVLGWARQDQVGPRSNPVWALRLYMLEVLQTPYSCGVCP